jgi:titin
VRLDWTDTSSSEQGFKVERSTDGTSFTVVAYASANVTSGTVYFLTPATTYWFRVRAYDGTADGPPSPAVQATTWTPPSAPTNVTATVLGASSVRVDWTDTSSSEQGFKIERSTDGTNFTIATYASANATTATVSTLTPATTYWFRVRAYDSFMDGSPSTAVQATTLPPPSAPANLTATVLGATSIRLDWTDTSSSEQGFKVERSTDGGSTWTSSGQVGANTVTFTNYGLAPATSYSFRVRAYDGSANSDPSNVAVAATLPPPPPPTGVTATPIGTTSIRLNWTDASTYESGFKVERSTDGTNFTVVAYAPANAGTATLYMLTPSTTYWFRVRAYEGITDGSPSPIVSAATYGPPPAPLAFSGQALSTTSVVLTWTNASTWQGGVTIERSSDGNSWTPMIQLGATWTSWTFAGLAPASSFMYRMRAYESTTTGPYTSTISVATFPPPAAPTNLATTVLNASSIQLTWTDNCSYETGYRVERSLDGGTTWSQAANFGANATSFTDYLSAHTTVWYRVRAYETLTNGDWSAVVTASVP